MWLTHVVLTVGWLCWFASLWLPALAQQDGTVMSGVACLRTSWMLPSIVLLFGVPNAIVMLAPLWLRRLGRRCHGAIALVVCLWLALAIIAALVIALPTGASDAATAGTARGMRLLIGGVLWLIALALTGAWVALCWLASRRRR